MRWFSSLYQRVMAWSKLPQAEKYLAILAFAESSFFPVPPDVMLAPMALAAPHRAWRFALITTVASVLGGLFGYAIGTYAFAQILPYLKNSHYWVSFVTAESWFRTWGFWAIFIAGFSPIPYKVFTIAAGVLSMSLLPFTLASLIGRGARFFMVAALMKWGGRQIESHLERYIDRIGWSAVAILLIAFAIFK